MTDHFKEKGRALLANGYTIVPILKGEKRPSISGWQKAQLTVDDLDRYPGQGVGVLCGQGAHPVIGVDIDISHPVISLAIIAWCKQNLGYAPERVGAAPRVLLVYRAEASGWAKSNSVQFFDETDPVKLNGKTNTQQVEILGNGQQFVAYHQHPDTHRDYEWVDLFSGIEYTRADELPLVTEAQIDALLAEVMRLVRATPSVKVTGSAESPAFKMGSDDLLSLSAPVGTSLPDITALLAYLPNESDDYDMWLKVGMALHHEYGATPLGANSLLLWRQYGSRSAKDDPAQYDYKWRSFGSNSSASTTLRWLLKITHQARRDSEVTERRAAVDQIKAMIRESDDSLRLGGEIAAKIKLLLPDDMLVRNEVIGAFQQQYKVLAGTAMPITQARNLLIGPRDGRVSAKRPMTEFGNAERMLDRYADSLMYVPEISSWFIWTGIYWRKAMQVEIEHLAKETIRALHNEIADVREDDRAAFYEWCAVSQQARMVANMVKLATSDSRVYVPAAELDKDSMLLGVRNGVIDLRTGRLIPPDQQQRITLVAGCDGDMSARAPLFESTVREVFSNDMDMVNYFYRSIGYALMGDPKEDVMFIPFGNGSNGKSTIFGVVRQVFGGYAKSAEASTFISDGKGANAGGAREDLVRLRGARFLYVNEPEENGELREASVKAMTGGDSITARGLYATASVEIKPTWAVFMPTNHKPIVKGNDNGIWRRLVLMPFLRNFEEDPQTVKDPNREEKLLAEMPGILALCVRAALEYQQHGLVAPAVVKSARESYRSQMDLLSEWLEQCCDVGNNYEEVSNRLWISWEIFAKSRGTLSYVKNSISLGKRLEMRFPGFKVPGGLRKRRGVQIKPCFSV